MNKYVEMFLSEEMIGNDGILTEIGLISLPKQERTRIQNKVSKRVKLTLKDLKK